MHRVYVRISAQVTTVTCMHQSQPSLHLLRTPTGNHVNWCGATSRLVGSSPWHFYRLKEHHLNNEGGTGVNVIYFVVQSDGGGGGWGGGGVGAR